MICLSESIVVQFEFVVLHFHIVMPKCCTFSFVRTDEFLFQI